MIYTSCGACSQTPIEDNVRHYHFVHVHDRTDTLAERFREFKTNTEKVRRKTYCANKKLHIIVFIIIEIVIGVVVTVALKHN